MVKDSHNGFDFIDFSEEDNGSGDDGTLVFPQEFASALGCLDPELLTVVRRVYGISRPKPQSYEEIASEIGATPDTIEKLHKSALRVLFRIHGAG